MPAYLCSLRFSFVYGIIFSTQDFVSKKKKGRYFMNRKTQKILAALAAVFLLAPSSAVVASAKAQPSSATNGTELYSYQVHKGLVSVSNKNLSSYARPGIVVQGKSLSVRGIVIGDTYYVPFRAMANALGAQYEYKSSTKTSTMKLGSLTLTASDGCYTSYANDRALFGVAPTVIMSDGRMYIPIDIFLKATGLRKSISGSTVAVSGTFSPLAHASNFYRSDEVLWLARIIHAEAQGEPLLGQIAVGNVVLNRVKSSDFPNTIYSVIFDRKYGVQFSPILNGSIYNTPSYNATLAAKICLEGFDISEGALYFLQPRLSTSSWIPKNRPYAFTIGNHDFYK